MGSAQGVATTIGNQASTVNISVIQVNLNKAHAAQVELLNKMNKRQSYIALIPEPYSFKTRLSIPPKNSFILPTNRENQPRAAIFCSKNIQIYEITELRHRDLAVGLTTLDGKKLL